MKHSIPFVLPLALFTAAGCGEEVNVNIHCITVATPAVECNVTQTVGKGEVEACWDFAVECGNGAVVTAPRTCQKVKDGGTEKVTIPGDVLTGLDKCGGTSPPKATVSNLTLNGKAAEFHPTTK